jgi:hypothetical protein
MGGRRSSRHGCRAGSDASSEPSREATNHARSGPPADEMTDRIRRRKPPENASTARQQRGRRVEADEPRRGSDTDLYIRCLASIEADEVTGAKRQALHIEDATLRTIAEDQIRFVLEIKACLARGDKDQARKLRRSVIGGIRRTYEAPLEDRPVGRPHAASPLAPADGTGAFPRSARGASATGCHQIPSRESRHRQPVDPAHRGGTGGRAPTPVLPGGPAAARVDRPSGLAAIERPQAVFTDPGRHLGDSGRRGVSSPADRRGWRAALDRGTFRGTGRDRGVYPQGREEPPAIPPARVRLEDGRGCEDRVRRRTGCPGARYVTSDSGSLALSLPVQTDRRHTCNAPLIPALIVLHKACLCSMISCCNGFRTCTEPASVRRHRSHLERSS